MEMKKGTLIESHDFDVSHWQHARNSNNNNNNDGDERKRPQNEEKTNKRGVRME